MLTTIFVIIVTISGPECWLLSSAFKYKGKPTLFSPLNSRAGNHKQPWGNIVGAGGMVISFTDPTRARQGQKGCLSSPPNKDPGKEGKLLKKDNLTQFYDNSCFWILCSKYTLSVANIHHPFSLKAGKERERLPPHKHAPEGSGFRTVKYYLNELKYSVFGRDGTKLTFSTGCIYLSNAGKGTTLQGLIWHVSILKGRLLNLTDLSHLSDNW